MKNIELLYKELLANPNDMFIRQVLTDACAEAGVYCPDLLGNPIVTGGNYRRPTLFECSSWSESGINFSSCSGSASYPRLPRSDDIRNDIVDRHRAVVGSAWMQSYSRSAYGSQSLFGNSVTQRKESVSNGRNKSISGCRTNS